MLLGSWLRKNEAAPTVGVVVAIAVAVVVARLLGLTGQPVPWLETFRHRRRTVTHCTMPDGASEAHPTKPMDHYPSAPVQR